MTAPGGGSAAGAACAAERAQRHGDGDEQQFLHGPPMPMKTRADTYVGRVLTGRWVVTPP